MSTAQVELEWDVADRMRKALRAADVGVGEMADYLGVNRNTVGRYINGHIAPDRRTLRLWAIRCGVPYAWLVGELPRMDSNHQPAGWSLDLGSRRVSVSGNKPQPDREILTAQRQFRQAVRRGSLVHLPDPASTVRPTCGQ